jgi:hypothetical protein
MYQARRTVRVRFDGSVITNKGQKTLGTKEMRLPRGQIRAGSGHRTMSNSYRGEGRYGVKKSNLELKRDIKTMPRMSHEHLMQRLTLPETLVAEELASGQVLPIARKLMLGMVSPSIWNPTTNRTPPCRRKRTGASLKEMTLALPLQRESYRLASRKRKCANAGRNYHPTTLSRKSSP